MTASVRIGILNDTADLRDGDGHNADQETIDWLEREIAEVQRAGRFDASVEFVHAYALGFPSGTAEAVERAYQQLADADVSLVVGPAIGDNALVLLPLSARLRLPTLNTSGAERAWGRYMFQHQSGSARDEAEVLVGHMVALGCGRLGLVHDQSPAGMRRLSAVRDGARTAELDLFTAPLPHGAVDAADLVHRLLSQGCDGFVYLGDDANASAIARELADEGWHGPRIMGYHGLPQGHEAFDGWFSIHGFSDANRTLAEVLSSLPGTPRNKDAIARGHDLGRIVAEALVRAPDLTREGVRIGLERIGNLPAAQGYEGTVLGFDAQERRALHGPYLVVRQWMDGETHEVSARADTPVAAGLARR